MLEEVWAPKNWGHGNSGRPQEVSSYRNIRRAKHMVRFLDHKLWHERTHHMLSFSKLETLIKILFLEMEGLLSALTLFKLGARRAIGPPCASGTSLHLCSWGTGSKCSQLFLLELFTLCKSLEIHLVRGLNMDLWSTESIFSFQTHFSLSAYSVTNGKLTVSSRKDCDCLLLAQQSLVIAGFCSYLRNLHPAPYFVSNKMEL